MATEVLIVVALVLANGLFAGAEIAVLSVQRVRIRERARAGDRKATAIERLRASPERFLATVQIGITVVGSAAAVFGGASIAATLTPTIEQLGLGPTAARDVAMAIVIATISILSLVLGELVPKSLGLRYSERYALLVGRPLLALSKLMRPLVWFLTGCSNLVLRVFRDRTSFTEARLSREELSELVAEATRHGSIDARGGEIASRALEFGDVMISEVMVRRDKIVAVPRDASPDDLQRTLLEDGHSRMPVYEGDLDRIVGYVVARDVLAVAWEQGLVVVDDIVRPLFAVPLTAKIGAVLRDMQTRRVQIAIVVDEHGGTAGLVTIEDLVEELVGEIIGENDAAEQLVREEPGGSVLVPGWVPIRKVNRALNTLLPISRESTTLAGLCMALALAVPSIGTRLRVTDGTVLEVVDASPRRVRMVRIHRRSTDESPDRGETTNA